MLTETFTTVSTANVPNTSLSGIVADPGPDDKPDTHDDVKAGPDGVLMTGDDIYLLPIAGVTVSILGDAARLGRHRRRRQLLVQLGADRRRQTGHRRHDRD